MIQRIGSSARAPGVDLLMVAIGIGWGFGVSRQPLLAGVALVGAGIVLLGLFRPRWLVPLMFLGILFDKLGVTGVKLANFPITASKLAVLGSLGLWCAHVALSRSRPFRWHPVLGALAALVATTGITTAYASSLAVGKYTLLGLAMMLVLVGLVLAMLAEADLQPLYRAIGGILIGVMLLSLVRAGGAGEAGRATGTMGDPNEWATMVLVLAPFLLGGLVDDDHATARPLRLALIGLAPLAVMMSGSRAALLVLAAVVPAIVVLCRRRSAELWACAAAAAMAAPFVLDFGAAAERFRQLIRRLRGESIVVRDQSLDERTELMEQGMDLFLDNWAVGAGPGNFETATGFVSEAGLLRPAHNSYLEIASEQGLLGLLAGAIFMATVGLTLVHAWRTAARPRDRSRLLGVSIGLGAVATMAATLGLVTFSMAYLVLGFALAVVHQSAQDHVEAG